MDPIISAWILFAQQLSPFLLSIFEFIGFSCALLFLFRYFQTIGVAAFIVLAILIGNIQILTHVNFKFMIIPLGTIAFSMLFVAINLLNLHYGKGVAKKAVFLTFYTQVFFACLILITMGYLPTAYTESYHISMVTLFSPSLRLFAASLISYTISQLFDIHLFNMLSKSSLWARFNISIWLSALLDNTIFSFLAFYVFVDLPYSIEDIVMKFILGTYWIRIIIGILETPIIYLSKTIKAPQAHQSYR
ncbi:MAG: queuosine precursor transporter [Alphaproteobacteria bacterium]|nr:MAG: queuosine precursor transporter [Alphaproteobacteria bacterium]